MAKTSTLNIRIDPKSKEQAEQLFATFGITISDAINIFLHQSIIYGGIPFSVKKTVPNFNTLEAMTEGDSVVAAGASRFSTCDEMFEDLGI